MRAIRVQWAEWINGCVAGICTAIGSAGTTYLGSLAFGTKIPWEAFGGGLLFTAIAAAFLWMATHKIPPLIETETTTTTTTVEVTQQTKTEAAPPPKESAQ